MTLDLSPEDRAAIERITRAHGLIVCSAICRSADEAIARHFIAEGMERAAVICDAAARKMDRTSPGQSLIAQECAAAIRAAKGQP